MKIRFLYFLLVLTIMGCEGVSSSQPCSDTAIAIVADFTEPQKVWPVADYVLPQFQLNKTPNAEAWLHISPVTDLQTNPLYAAHLPNRATTDMLNAAGDAQFRNRCIVQFYGDTKKAFAEMYRQFDSTASLKYSECFTAVAAQLKWLVSVKAKTKMLFIFSDLIEKGFFGDAYASFTDQDMYALRQKFENAKLLPEKLDNIKAVIVFQPCSRRDQMMFNAMAEMYRIILEKRGAKMEIQSSANFSKL